MGSHEPFKNNFFLRRSKKELAKNREILRRLLWFPIAIDRAWSTQSGGSPWCSRKSRTAWQNRAKIFAGKTAKTKFWPDFFHFFEQDRLLFARVDISRSAWQNFRQKQPKKKKEKMSLRFFFKSGRAHPVFNEEFHFFGRGKTNSGGWLQNWLSNDHPGAYTSIPHPFFGAKEVCYIEKNVAK